MDTIIQNVESLKNSIQRKDFSDVSVIDIFSAFYIILQKPIDSSISDDRYFSFLLGCLRNVPQGDERKYWLETIYSSYEKLSLINPNNANWTLLKANLLFLAPIRIASFNE